MIRKDKEITSRLEIDQVINAALVCRMAFARENEPYLVPLSFGYDGSRLYFHSARKGRKLDFIQANKRVCFEFERDVRLVPHPSDACEYSFAYESVIGYGTVEESVTPEAKAYGLNQIARHYSGRDWEYDPEDVTSPRVWVVEIETLTGKRNPRSKEE